jgi:hypothetical protein
MKFSLGLAVVLLIAVGARSVQAQDDLPGVNHLPAPFSKFSSADVLAQVFPSYDRERNRESEFPNEEGKPALVKIVEAKPWTAAGQRHLVVFVEIAVMDGSYESLCGNCLDYGLLAVLREDGGKLALVARQETGPYSPAKHPEDGEVGVPPGATAFSGHDQVTLDLAPYRLTADETLIGVRTEHIWMPASDWGTHLEFFRIVGGKLKSVFETTVINRKYPDGNTGPVVKTTAILSSKPAGRFHDLLIDRSTIRCPGTPESAGGDDGDWDCSPERKNATRVGRQQERWRFDGAKFVLKGD